MSLKRERESLSLLCKFGNRGAQRQCTWTEFLWSLKAMEQGVPLGLCHHPMWHTEKDAPPFLSYLGPVHNSDLSIRRQQTSHTEGHSVKQWTHPHDSKEGWGWKERAATRPRDAMLVLDWAVIKESSWMEEGDMRKPATWGTAVGWQYCHFPKCGGCIGILFFKKVLVLWSYPLKYLRIVTIVTTMTS